MSTVQFINLSIDGLSAYVLGAIQNANCKNISLYYQNKKGEKNTYLLDVKNTYQEAKIKDIQTLEKMSFEGIYEVARVQLLQSMKTPNKARSQAQKDAYTYISKGLKYSHKSKKMVVYGLLERKTTHYRPLGVQKKQSTLDKVKSEIISKFSLMSRKYKQFLIDPKQLGKMAINGNVLEVSNI